MKFLQRYDIQEQISSGPVEVFLGLEIGSDVKRLIHVAKIKNLHGEISSEQALAMFRERAPDPVGTILEAGRFERTSYIYVVTSLPSDPLAVQRWVQRYRAFANSRATAKGPPSAEHAAANPINSPFPGSQDLVANLGPIDATANIIAKASPAESSSRAASQVPGEFTIAFQNLSAPPVLGNPATDPKPAAPSPARQESGAFTKQFLAALQEEPHQGTTAVDRLNSEPVAADPRTFTNEFFRVGVQPPNSPRVPQNTLSAVDGKDLPAINGTQAKSGEFTQYFRGMPAEKLGSTRADVPSLHDQVPKRKNEQVGAFTDLFGPMGPRDARPVTPSELSVKNGRSLAAPHDELLEPVTQREFFNTNLGSDAGSLPGVSPSKIGQVATPLQKQSLQRSPAFESASSGSIPEPKWGEEEGEGATKVFTPKSEPPVSSQPVVPAGPSEFTRIISPAVGPPPPNPAASEGALPGALSSSPSMPSLKPPSVQVSSLSPPQITPPSMPHADLAVKPPTPLTPAPLPKPRFSYVPLIIVLNVLLIAAIAVVLYFALRPH